MQPGSTNTRSRGFASMDSNKQREIARKGGRAAHEKGTAHEFTADEARAAGRKGGERVSSNREHMSRIGRLGGKMSAGRRQAVKSEGNGNSGGDGHPSPEHGQASPEESVAPEAEVAMPPASQSV
jgi:general stress protein YciG